MPEQPDNPTQIISSEYTVGYRRPPSHAQFKKGQSGNPRGRIKKTKSFLALLADELEERVLINEGGTKKWITKREALAKQFANKGAAGDLKAVKLLAEILQHLDKVRGTDFRSEVVQSGSSARERIRAKLDKIAKAIEERDRQRAIARGSPDTDMG